MTAELDDKNFGHWLRDRIEAMGVKKQTAATRIGVAAVTLRAWFSHAAPGMAAHNRVQVAKLLGVPLEEVERRLEEARRREAEQVGWEKGVGFDRQVKAASAERDVIAATRAAARGWRLQDDPNVAPYSERAVPDVPYFEAPLAAGNWSDVSDVGVVNDPRKIDIGFFRVRLRGDSMTPDYPDGQVVEFRCLRADRDGVIVGRDYYVQHVDGEATFKRLESASEETFHLRPLNRVKYPELMVVERALVVRMALAVAKVDVIG